MDVDARNVPGAYITDRRKLYLIIDILDVPQRKVVVLENCADGLRERIDTWRVKCWPWRLVRAAPVVPDTYEA